jgi:hypothetical protein
VRCETAPSSSHGGSSVFDNRAKIVSSFRKRQAAKYGQRYVLLGVITVTKRPFLQMWLNCINTRRRTSVTPFPANQFRASRGGVYLCARLGGASCLARKSGVMAGPRATPPFRCRSLGLRRIRPRGQPNRKSEAVMPVTSAIVRRCCDGSLPPEAAPWSMRVPPTAIASRRR